MISPSVMESVETNGNPILGRTFMLTETLNGKIIGTWCCMNAEDPDFRQSMLNDLMHSASVVVQKGE